MRDLRILRRDRSALIFTFGMPIILTFVFGSMNGGHEGGGGGPKGGFKMAVARQDTGARAEQALEKLREAGINPIAVPGGADEMEKLIGSGKYAAGIVIPPDFTTKFNASITGQGEAPVLPFVADPGDTRVASMIKSMVAGANERLVAQEVIRQYPDAAIAMLNRPKIQMPDTEIKGQALTAGDIFLPGFMVYFVFTLANGVAATLLGERQEGTLRRMLNAPISRSQILAGKLLARGVLGGIQTLMLIGMGVQWLHLSVAQAPVGIAITAVATIFSACGMGLLMATFGKTMEQIQGMTTMFLLLLGFISGTLIPRALLPEWMVKISYITPHAWALNAYQDLIQRHHSLMSTLPNIGVELLFGSVFFGLALARFKFE